MNKTYLYASIAGIVPAMMEFFLVYLVEPNSNHWLLLQVSLFWFSCGFVNYLISLKTPLIATRIIITILLCSPWYIAESILIGKPEHFIPLVISSIVLGLIIGLLCKWLKKKEQSNQ